MNEQETFVDTLILIAVGGKGGDGAVSFHRERFLPRGGPDGGDGGHGGKVILKASSSVQSLSHLSERSVYKASAGKPGGSSLKHGSDGEDLILEVPLGTVVYDNASGRKLADLVKEGDTFVAARGGRGGRGNKAFTTPTLQAPRYAERGGNGETRELRLEIKLIADVALVGAPNAGKSSLLAAITAARPKIAPYPFTTLNPVRGTIQTLSHSVVICDIPGLIEGASKGKGLGLDFLRHAERTRLLVHVLDGQLQYEQVVASFEAVNKEIRAYSPELLERLGIVVLNKIDLDHARHMLADIASYAKTRGYKFVATSALTGEGCGELVLNIQEELKHERYITAQKAADPHFRPVIRPRPQRSPISVVRLTDGFLLRGTKLEKLVRETDFSDEDELARFQRLLDEMGVNELLEQAGAVPGDRVVVGRMEFTYER